MSTDEQCSHTSWYPTFRRWQNRNLGSMIWKSESCGSPTTKWHSMINTNFRDIFEIGFKTDFTPFEVDFLLSNFWLLCRLFMTQLSLAESSRIVCCRGFLLACCSGGKIIPKPVWTSKAHSWNKMIWTMKEKWNCSLWTWLGIFLLGSWENIPTVSSTAEGGLRWIEWVLWQYYWETQNREIQNRERQNKQ